MISLNQIATNLSTMTCKAMALFHAFTGSDSTSAFKFKGKRSCCAIMHEVPWLMEQFATDTPYQISIRLKEAATNFVCKLYINEVGDDIDLVRLRLFSEKTRDVALHLKRSVFQASIWTSAHMTIMPVNNPTEHDWKEENNKLLPVWTSIPLAEDFFLI